MSDETKKTVLNTLAEPIANSAKNITDKPTQNIGTTLADIWYLVFGGISQAAEKRKLKYSYALQEFENELKEKISKIPKDKLTEPDIQIIAPALEASKYCVEKEELRNIFSSLIATSLTDEYIPPILIDIVKHLSVIDAKLLNYLYINHTIKEHITDLLQFLNINDPEILYISLMELEQMSLICNISVKDKKINESLFIYKNIINKTVILENLKLSPLGLLLCNICNK